METPSADSAQTPVTPAPHSTQHHPKITHFSRTLVATAAAAAAACTFLVAQATPANALPKSTAISQTESLYRGYYWINAKVKYSEDTDPKTWYSDVDHSQTYRKDCSGMVSMEWNLSSSMVTTTLSQVSHLVDPSIANQSDLTSVGNDARLASYQELQRGDILLSHTHVATFLGWSDPSRTKMNVMEEPRPGLTAHLAVYSTDYATNGGFLAYRYNRMVMDVGHDYDSTPNSGNITSNSDVLAATSSGDGYFLHFDSTGKFSTRTALGMGWSYRSYAAMGYLGHDSTPSVLAETSSNEGYVLRFTKDGKFAGRDDLGNGWSYDSLTPIGDVTGDGSSDILAVTKGTGYVLSFDSAGKLSNRVPLGTGWTYAHMGGVGDLDGDGSPDVIATDAGGTGWLLHFNSSGQFSGRTQLGTGYGYDSFTGLGDANGDGLNDVLAVTDGTAYLMHFAPDGKFTGRDLLGTGWRDYGTRMTS